MADVIWTSEVPDFFQTKKNGMLEAYVSPETNNIVNPYSLILMVLSPQFVSAH